MLELKNKLIVALDVSTKSEAEHFVDILSPYVKYFKVGSQLFTACGPDIVKTIRDKGGKVFLDLKFHDIPKTVFSAVTSGTAMACSFTPISVGYSDISKCLQPSVFMMTVHTKGGLEMLRAAVKGATEKAADLGINKPFIVGVTRLTSDQEGTDTKQEVLQASRLAKDAGLDGVVCAVSEAQLVRSEFGPKFIIVTPGIRQKGAAVDDQKRIATAAQALAAGSDYLVVGRPIIEAKDPLSALEELV